MTSLQRLYIFLCYTLPCQVEWQMAEAGAALHLAAERGILSAQGLMQQATPICDYLDRSYEPASEMGKVINCAIKYQHQSSDKVRQYNCGLHSAIRFAICSPKET